MVNENQKDPSKNTHTDSAPFFCPNPETLEFDLSTAFYDLVFGSDTDQSVEISEFEEEVCNQLSDILDNDTELSAYIPPLPGAVHQLIEVLQQENADFDQLQGIISRDISLTVDVVRVANCPLYRRTQEPVDSLEHAIRNIGINGVGAIATASLLRGVLHVKPVYYKWFGEIIWKHSLECALACQYLSCDSQKFTAYLLGLIHDVGKIVIFRCLVEVLTTADSNTVPRSKWFKLMMTEDSLWLSVLIAQEWEFSQDIVTALEQQKTPSDNDLAKTLYLANVCSEIHLLVDAGGIGSSEGQKILEQFGLAEKSIHDLFAIMGSVAP